MRSHVVYTTVLTSGDNIDYMCGMFSSEEAAVMQTSETVQIG